MENVSSVFVAGTALPYNSTTTTSRYFDWYFTPSSTIAGKRCVLQVKNCFLSYPGSTIRVGDDQIWIVSMDLTQTHGQAYFDSSVNSSTVVPTNTTVAMLSSYYATNEQPRVVLTIPPGPQIVRITFKKADGSAAVLYSDSAKTALNSLYFGLGMEITPID